MFSKLTIRTPQIVQQWVYYCALNSSYKIKRCSSSFDQPAGYVFVKPKSYETYQEMFSKLSIRTPQIVQQWVYSCAINSSYKIKRCSSSFDQPAGYVFVKPKRLLNVPYALTVPTFANNQEAISNVKEMDELFPEVTDNLKDGQPYAEIPEIMDHLKRAVEYMVPYGKRARSIRIMQDYKRLAKPEDQTAENWKQVKILCWIQEIMHSAVLLSDDIMDNTEMRRGKKTWCKQPEIGKRATLDTLLMQEFGFQLLHKYWQNHPSYITLLKLLHKYVFYTFLGQGYSLTFRDDVTGRIKFEEFTMQNYRRCVKYKTTSNAIIPPFELSLAAAKVYNPQVCSDVKHILHQIGVFLQIQNDFQDLFRDRGQLITKSVLEQPTIGLDIPTGELTWLSAQAFECATEDQKRTLIDNYGRNDPNCVETVYRLYEEMRLDEVLLEYEESSFRWLESEIRKVNNCVLRAILQDHAEVFYKRRPNV